MLLKPRATLSLPPRTLRPLDGDAVRRSRRRPSHITNPRHARHAEHARPTASAHSRELSEAVVANKKIYQWLASGDLFPWSVPSGLALLVGVVFVVDLVRRDAIDTFPIALTGARRVFGFGALSAAFVAAGLVLLIGMPSKQFIYFQF